jgi:pyridoxine 5-phosphate synthase
VRIKPSHLDLWVGAKITEEFVGIENPLLIIFFLLKKKTLKQCPE